MAKPHEIYLMVDPVGDQVFPVSCHGFDVITAPKARVLARNCVALFLGSDGNVIRIEKIEHLQASLFTSIKAFLGWPTPVRCHFEPVDVSVDDFRTMALDARRFMRARSGVEDDEWWLLSASDADVEGRLGAAKSLSALYQSIPFPDDQDCLDLL